MSFLHIYFIAAVLVLLLILKMTMPAVFSNTLYSQKSLHCGNLKILVQSVLFLFMFKGTLPPTSAFLLMLLFSSFKLFCTLPPF